MSRKKILVTGARGFVGRRFIGYNANRFDLIPASLSNTPLDAINFSGVDCIVHLAGKAHDPNTKDPAEYFKVNYELTQALADRAKANYVSQFIYISTVKVYGDNTYDNLNEDSECHAVEPYGLSKLQAEKYLSSIASNDFIVSIIRPPLIYGPGVKGNMLRFLHLCKSRSTLPFGKMNNRRSIVFVDNLIELINRIIDNRAKGIFVAGDPEPVSTESILTLISRSMGREVKLVSLPGPARKLIRLAMPGIYNRLFGSFVINNQRTNEELKFTPPYSTDFGILKMVEWFKQKANE